MSDDKDSFGPLRDSEEPRSEPTPESAAGSDPKVLAEDAGHGAAGPARDAAHADGPDDPGRPHTTPACDTHGAGTRPPPPGPAWLAWLLDRSDLLLLVYAALILASLLSLGLWDPWETRVAEIARKMLEHGEWKALRGPSGPISLPPLPFWMMRLSIGLLGLNEIAVRLPAALSALALLAVLLWVGRRRWGLGVALGSCVALLSSSHFLLQGGLALGNMPLIASQSILMLLLIELTGGAGHQARGHAQGSRPAPRGLLVSGSLLAGLATYLSGGPLAMGMPAAVLGVWWLLDPRDRTRRSVALCLLAAVGTSILLFAVLGDRSAWSGLGLRWSSFVPGSLDAAETFEHFIYQIVFGLFPWSLLLPAALFLLARRAAAAPGGEVASVPSARDATLILLWLLFGFASAVVGLRLGRQPLFLALPAVVLSVALASEVRPDLGPGSKVFSLLLLALLWVGGQGLLRAPDSWLHGLVGDGKFAYPQGLRMPRWIRSAIYLWAAGLLLHALQPAHWLRPVLFGPRKGPAARPWALPDLLEPLLRTLAWLESRGRPLLLVGVLGLVLAAGGALHVVPSLTHHLSQRSVFDSFRGMARPEDEIYSYRLDQGSSDFYLGGLPRLSSRKEFLDRLTRVQPTFAVIPRRRLAEINNAFRGRVQRHLHVLDDRSSKLLLVANHLPQGEEDLNPIRRVLLTEPPEAAYTVAAVMERSVELIGADLSSDSVALGGSLEITYYFKVLRPVSRRWKVFVHMETPRHRIDTGKTDHDPAGGVYPTNSWRVGDIVKDTHRIRVPVFSPLGTYTLRVGLFAGDTRMKVDDASKHDGQNRILVTRIEVRAL